MPTDFSRRLFLGGSGALLAHGLLAKAQSQPLPDGRGSAGGGTVTEGGTVGRRRGGP
jgi:PDZ domain-containing secreted protein